jgi:hypothetical protein
MGRGVQILGCSDHAGESIPPDPMRTGSSRVAHGMYAIVVERRLTLWAEEQGLRARGRPAFDMIIVLLIISSRSGP